MPLLHTSPPHQYITPAHSTFTSTQLALPQHRTGPLCPAITVPRKTVQYNTIPLHCITRLYYTMPMLHITSNNTALLYHCLATSRVTSHYLCVTPPGHTTLLPRIVVANHTIPLLRIVLACNTLPLSYITWPRPQLALPAPSLAPHCIYRTITIFYDSSPLPGPT